MILSRTRLKIRYQASCKKMALLGTVESHFDRSLLLLCSLRMSTMSPGRWLSWLVPSQYTKVEGSIPGQGTRRNQPVSA